MKQFKYDEIGYWSEIKLHIIREYASAYSKILAAQSAIKCHIYIDAFAGAGKHVSKRTGEFVAGSPLNALLVRPPFSEIHLVDLHGGKAEELRILVGARKDVLFTSKMPTRCCWIKYSHGAVTKASAAGFAFSIRTP